MKEARDIQEAASKDGWTDLCFFVPRLLLKHFSFYISSTVSVDSCIFISYFLTILSTR
jgi:hypothetical protein